MESIKMHKPVFLMLFIFLCLKNDRLLRKNFEGTAKSLQLELLVYT